MERPPLQIYNQMIRCGRNLDRAKLLRSCLFMVAIDYLMIGGYFGQFVVGYENPRYSTQITRTSSLQARNQDARPLSETSSPAESEKNHIPRSIYDDMSTSKSCDFRAAAAGFLLADSTDRKLNKSDAIDRNLSEILDRDGPDMRPSRNNSEFHDISQTVSIRAWDLLHEHAALAIEQQISAALPILKELLDEAKVGKKCLEALSDTMQGAQRLESWAVKLLNSWGRFPMNGLFDGTYGDVGSFDSCVNIKHNRYIDHAHYCTVTFRPVMPSIKNYELIVRKEPKVLRYHFETHNHPHAANDLNATSSHDKRSNVTLKKERDAFSDLLESAQYYHYVYYKWGTCWPIACSPFEVKRLTKLVSRKSILLSGPVRCFSLNESDYEQTDELFDQMDDKTNATTKKGKKLVITTQNENGGIYIWKPHLYLAHKIAITIVAIITAFIVFMTLVDICANRIPSLYRVVSMSAKGLPVEHIINGKPNQQRRHLGAASCQTRTTVSTSVVCDGTTATTTTMNDFSHQQMHPIRPGFSMVPCDEGVEVAEIGRQEPTDWMIREQRIGLFMSIVDDFSICTNVPQFFKVSANQMRTDILCLNGIRCITMVWVIMTHTIAYNDWAQFARTKSIEVALNSPINQPLFNASYLVDTFFLMSGLLSAFTAFRHCQGISSKFNSLAYIFGRWLRLTPQIFFVSMLFIIVPILSSGPHWYFIVGEYSENCMENWWINVLHLQSFYKTDKMCNFVTWWISIDFFYHFFALAIIWTLMLAGHRAGFLSIMALLAASVGYQSYRHYTLALPPNLLSTIPQTGVMWATMTLEFFWLPYTHAVPFFFGFYTGYIMALKKKMIMAKMNTRRALIGWTLSTGLLVGQCFSTYWWVTGQASYSKIVSTIFFGVCSIVWAGSICWIIIACQHGYGGFVNRVLSWKVFIVLGKASYLVYLSHFQILFLYFGNQNILLEPSTMNMLYMVLGNITLATIYGIFLCSVYELPWLKMHRRLMKYV